MLIKGQCDHQKKKKKGRNARKKETKAPGITIHGAGGSHADLLFTVSQAWEAGEEWKNEMNISDCLARPLVGGAAYQLSIACYNADHTFS